MNNFAVDLDQALDDLERLENEGRQEGKSSLRCFMLCVETDIETESESPFKENQLKQTHFDIVAATVEAISASEEANDIDDLLQSLIVDERTFSALNSINNNNNNNIKYDTRGEATSEEEPLTPAQAVVVDDADVVDTSYLHHPSPALAPSPPPPPSPSPPATQTNDQDELLITFDQDQEETLSPTKATTTTTTTCEQPTAERSAETSAVHDVMGELLDEIERSTSSSQFTVEQQPTNATEDVACDETIVEPEPEPQIPVDTTPPASPPANGQEAAHEAANSRPDVHVSSQSASVAVASVSVYRAPVQITDYQTEWSQLTESEKTLGLIAPVWLPDADADACMKCSMRFTFRKRRHHCRACGLVFCSTCCSSRLVLAYKTSTATSTATDEASNASQSSQATNEAAATANESESSGAVDSSRMSRVCSLCFETINKGKTCL